VSTVGSSPGSNSTKFRSSRSSSCSAIQIGFTLFDKSPVIGPERILLNFWTLQFDAATTVDTKELISSSVPGVPDELHRIVDK
jgi:hypothetical protein